MAWQAWSSNCFLQGLGTCIWLDAQACKLAATTSERSFRGGRADDDWHSHAKHVSCRSSMLQERLLLSARQAFKCS